MRKGEVGRSPFYDLFINANVHTAKRTTMDVRRVEVHTRAFILLAVGKQLVFETDLNNVAGTP